MIIVAALISVSGFCWFLIILFRLFTVQPSLSVGLAQLIFLIFLPVILSYYINRRLFYSGPTIFKIILLNILQSCLYSALTVWLFHYLQYFWLLPVQWPASSMSAIYYTIWQLAMWSCGTYFAIKPQKEKQSISPAGIIYISLSAIPPFFLLVMTNFPSSGLILIIFSWYFTLTFALAAKNGGQKHYDFILLHNLIPCLIATFLFFILYSDQLKSLIKGVYRVLLAIKSFIFYLLSLLNNINYENSVINNSDSYMNSNITGYSQVVVNKVFIECICFIILAPLCVFLFWELTSSLRIRITPRERPLPGSRFSMADTFRKSMAEIVLFVKGLMIITRRMLRHFGNGILLFKRYFASKVKALLPPPTADQAIFRIYLNFLRWGRHHHLRRGAAETPLEYSARLEKFAGEYPACGQEIRMLTWHFIQMKYRNIAADWQTAKECKNLLKRIEGTQRGASLLKILPGKNK